MKGEAQWRVVFPARQASLRKQQKASHTLSMAIRGLNVVAVHPKQNSGPTCFPCAAKVKSQNGMADGGGTAAASNAEPYAGAAGLGCNGCQ